MKCYIVRLLKRHTAQPDQVKNGFLSSGGTIQHYEQHEARKKARIFGGISEIADYTPTTTKKPYELVKPAARNLEQEHLEKAADFINRLFAGKTPIKPDSQCLVTLKPMAGITKKQKVWRMHWKITEEYLKNAWIFGGLKTTRNDIKHNRRYVADVYLDGHVSDYIITPGQPTNTRKEAPSL